MKQTFAQAISATIREEMRRDDKIIVYGHGYLTGGTVEAMNDHRIVMSAAIAASICEEPVIIHGAEAVNKSYPTFFEDFAAME